MNRRPRAGDDMLPPRTPSLERRLANSARRLRASRDAASGDARNRAFHREHSAVYALAAVENAEFSAFFSTSRHKVRGLCAPTRLTCRAWETTGALAVTS